MKFSSKSQMRMLLAEVFISDKPKKLSFFTEQIVIYSDLPEHSFDQYLKFKEILPLVKWLFSNNLIFNFFENYPLRTIRPGSELQVFATEQIAKLFSKFSKLGSVFKAWRSFLKPKSDNFVTNKLILWFGVPPSRLPNWKFFFCFHGASTFAGVS